MAAFDCIKLFCLIKLTLHSVKVSSSPNSPLLFAIVSLSKKQIEAVFRRFSSKEMFLKILQISQENNSVGVSF